MKNMKLVSAGGHATFTLDDGSVEETIDAIVNLRVCRIKPKTGQEIVVVPGRVDFIILDDVEEEPK